MAYRDFELWKIRVNECLLSICGLDSDFIEDWSYFKDYEEGYRPIESAKRALKNAGY